MASLEYTGRTGKIDVIFFGDSLNLFSNRHFEALLESAGAVQAVVDTPKDDWRSTHTGEAENVRSFPEYAYERNIPVFSPKNPNEKNVVSRLRALKPDLFIAVGYNRIMREELLQVPRFPPYNFHASLLPAYRGKHPVFWALRNDEPEAGLTVHCMDTGLDTGDVVYQVRVKTRRDDTVSSLYKRIIDKSVGLIPRLIRDAEQGRVPRRPQSAEGASYYSSVTEETFLLDFTMPARLLRRWISVTPGKCYFVYKGKKVFVHKAETKKNTGADEERAGKKGETRTAETGGMGTILQIGRSSAAVITGPEHLSAEPASQCTAASQMPESGAASARHAFVFGGRYRRVSRQLLWIQSVSTEKQVNPISMARFCRLHGLGPGDSLAITHV